MTAVNNNGGTEPVQKYKNRVVSPKEIKLVAIRKAGSAKAIIQRLAKRTLNTFTDVRVV